MTTIYACSIDRLLNFTLFSRFLYQFEVKSQVYSPSTLHMRSPIHAFSEESFRHLYGVPVSDIGSRVGSTRVITGRFAKKSFTRVNRVDPFDQTADRWYSAMRPYWLKYTDTIHRPNILGLFNGGGGGARPCWHAFFAFFSAGLVHA